MITKDQINRTVEIIVKNYHPDKIILFGSYASGNIKESSDLDLLIIKDSELPGYKRGSEVRKLLRGNKIPMDILVYTKAEIEKWKNVNQAFITQIVQNGKVLYG